MLGKMVIRIIISHPTTLGTYKTVDLRDDQGPLVQKTWMASCLVEKKADQKETEKSKEIRLVPMKDGPMEIQKVVHLVLLTATQKVEGLAFLTATLKVEGSAFRLELQKVVHLVLPMVTLKVECLAFLTATLKVTPREQHLVVMRVH